MEQPEPIRSRLPRLAFAALAAVAAVAAAAVVVHAFRHPPPRRDFTPRWGDNVMGAATNATEGLAVKIDRMTDLMVFGGTLLLGALLLILASICLLIAVHLRTQSMLRGHRAPGPFSIGGGGGTSSSTRELSAQSDTG